VRNIALTLEYDGAEFYGLQVQKNKRTVQSELESALRKLFGEKIRAVASGRTDSGVHAEAQVAHFKTKSKIPLEKIVRGLNHYLPEDLAVTAIKAVPISFHAQRSAKWKTYEYRIFNSRARSPLKRKHTFFVPYVFNLSKMKRAAKLLSGKHDFRAFETSGSRRKSAVRTIRKFDIKKVGNDITITVEANGFLYNMVRSLVGTLLEVARGRMEFSDLKRVLASKNRSQAGPTAPAHGLILRKVSY
jgi:tRNA pseudouridine38-40 synthase